MSKRKTNYRIEFKKKVVESSFARGSVTQLYRGLDIPTSELSRGGRESNQYGKSSFPGRGKPRLTDQQREIAE